MAHEEHQTVHQGHDMGGDEHAGHDAMAMAGRNAGGADHSGHGVDHSGHEQRFRQRFWVCLVLTIPVLLFSETIQDWLNFSIRSFTGDNWIAPVFAVVIFAYGGTPFLQMAVPEAQRRQPGMMTLISLAIGVAFTYSVIAFALDTGGEFFWELATLIDVMLLGHWLEMRSVRQASGALDELAKLMPDTAERVSDDGSTEEVAVSDLKEGNIVLVRPGANVPIDGVVVDGSSGVNEALITGESAPVLKEPGDNVIGGSTNGEGSLRIRVTAVGDATALAGIMRLVEEAQRSKSATELLADRVAGWLFYTAVGVAALTAITWAAIVGFEGEIVRRVATVLVIACPHALGLAIPLVVAISTAKSASNGILVRDRGALESARLVDVVVFDKTGTLTMGEFGVAGVAVFGNLSEDEALALTAALEGDSEHLIARAVRGEAEQRGLAAPRVSNFEALKGRGVKGDIDGVTYHLGGPRLIETLLNAPPSGSLTDFIEEAGAQGRTVVHLVRDGDVVASVALADKIRPESKDVVSALQSYGIEVAMLTGDSQAVADSVAQELDIDTAMAEVLPEHKDQKVSELQGEGKRVLMVGDGVNDAPALTRADIGVAIGGGTDVAIESADIVLVQSNPLDVVKAIVLSRLAYRKMIQNLVWATGYNVFALPLAAGVLAPVGVLLSPAVGAAFMSVSTIIVAINAQLLRAASLAPEGVGLKGRR
jgi:Cu2+-exporting ATPase